MSTVIKAVSILSIDAWAQQDDGEEGTSWSWNAWYKIGEVSLETLDTLDTNEKVMAYLIAEGYLNPAATTLGYIDDDQYNLVFCDNETNEPMIAIAYGEAQ